MPYVYSRNFCISGVMAEVRVFLLILNTASIDFKWNGPVTMGSHVGFKGQVMWWINLFTTDSRLTSPSGTPLIPGQPVWRSFECSRAETRAEEVRKQVYCAAKPFQHGGQAKQGNFQDFSWKKERFYSFLDRFFPNFRNYAVDSILWMIKSQTKP